jgi:NTE family protein
VVCKRTIIILFLILMGFSQAVQAEPAPNAGEKLEVTDKLSDIAGSTAEPYCSCRVTLVLGGGGCKALAEIGVLKVFAKNKIPINYIVGTSAGAIVGALYAANVPLADIEQMAYDGSLQRTMTPHLTKFVICFPFSKLIHLFGSKPYAGLASGSQLEKFLRKRLPDDFSDLKIPFAAVATDLESGNTCMITSGDLCKAVVASSAMPILIRPVMIADTLFIDGGIKANLPTHCAQLTAADIIIAVPADAPIRTEKKSKFHSMRGLALRVTDMMEAEIDKHRWEEADLVIYPKVGDTPPFTKDQEVIKCTIAAGEEAATAALPRLKVLFNSKTSHKL